MSEYLTLTPVIQTTPELAAHRDTASVVRELISSVNHLMVNAGVPDFSSLGNDQRSQENETLLFLLHYIVYLNDDEVEFNRFLREFGQESSDILMKCILSLPELFNSFAINTLSARKDLLAIAKMIDVHQRVKMTASQRIEKNKLRQEAKAREAMLKLESAAAEKLLSLVATTYTAISDPEKKPHRETLEKILALVDLRSVSARIEFSQTLARRMTLTATTHKDILVYFDRLTKMVRKLLQADLPVSLAEYQELEKIYQRVSKVRQNEQ